MDSSFVMRIRGRDCSEPNRDLIEAQQIIARSHSPLLHLLLTSQLDSGARNTFKSEKVLRYEATTIKTNIAAS